jgi:type VI secretion system protein VasD
VACVAAMVLSVVACSSAPKVTTVNGSIDAATGLNPSVTQRPSPLMLRVYELKSDATFNQADFMSLYQSDQATLGADLVAKEEMMLQPGESRPYARKLSAETRFVGVVAAYRNLEQATWRSIAAVQPGRAQKIAIRAEPLAVSATVSP